jgi:ferritin-like metal-binding protein YciE
MAMKTMRDLLVEELREILDAEKQAVRAYPKIMKMVSSAQLKEAIEQHTEETKNQIERLNQIFDELDMRTRGKACEALRGLVEDVQELMDKGLSPELQDVAIIASAQKMEHFEIAAYGSASAHAEALGLDNCVKLLQETLKEEKATDAKLNKIALGEVNKRAVSSEAEEGEQAEGRESGKERRQRMAEVDRAAAGDKPRSKK